MDKYTYDNIYIYNLYCKNKININQKILEQRKFERIKLLHCHSKKNIINVNHLADSLKELYCGYGCGIDRNGTRSIRVINS